MTDSKLRNTLLGFAVVGAGFGGADGFLISESAPGIMAGALIGALLGAGFVLLAWRPRPQDTQESRPAHEAQHPNYMAIWAALFALTILEVGVAFVALPKGQIIAALLILAVWKALLVALYYMHLKFEPRRLWLLAASPLPLAVILVVAVLSEGW